MWHLCVACVVHWMWHISGYQLFCGSWNVPHVWQEMLTLFRNTWYHYLWEFMISYNIVYTHIHSIQGETYKTCHWKKIYILLVEFKLKYQDVSILITELIKIWTFGHTGNVNHIIDKLYHESSQGVNKRVDWYMEYSKHIHIMYM